MQQEDNTVALTRAIEAARGRGRPANDDSQARAELRLEELSKVHDIPTEYARRGRKRDLEIESLFGTLYRLADDDEERAAAVRAFMAWEHDEEAEKADVRDIATETARSLARHNPVWIDGQSVPEDWLEGQYVPTGSDGAA